MIIFLQLIKMVYSSLFKITPCSMGLDFDCIICILQFVHCIVWAKELLFAKLFGDKNQANDLNVRSSDGASSSEQAEDVFEHRNDEDIEQYGRRIYDHVFGYNIEQALSNEETWKNRYRPRPIYSRDVMPNELGQQNGSMEKNGASNDVYSVSSMASLGMKNPQDIWSLMENSRVFLEALKLFFLKRQKVSLNSCSKANHCTTIYFPYVKLDL